MKKLTTLVLSFLALVGIGVTVSAASYMQLQEELNNIKIGLLIVLIMLCVTILLEIILRVLVYPMKRIRGRKVPRSAGQQMALRVLNLALVWVFITAGFGVYRYCATVPKMEQVQIQTPTTDPTTSSVPLLSREQP